MRAAMDAAALVAERLRASIEVKRLLLGQAEAIAGAAAVLVDAIRGGGKVLFCGNGGSAADAQHLACELTGRFRRDRRALPAVALTVDTSTLTAVANDYGFETVFRRQVEGLGQAGDVLVLLSTSGTSPNVLAAAEAARERGLATIALTGSAGGPLADRADHCLRVPSEDTPRIQECHITIGHILCELVEEALCPEA